MIPFLRKFALVICLLAPMASFADKYQNTISDFKDAARSERFFDEAYAFAVFPIIGKGGFGIGAAHGRGKVFVKGNETGDVSMTQITIGFQLGGQTFSQIIFFKDVTSYERFTTGTFEFSAQANAVAITLGASIETSTKGNSIAITTGEDSQTVTSYYNGMAVYTLTKGGLMYEASIGGQKFKFKPKYKGE